MKRYKFNHKEDNFMKAIGLNDGFYRNFSVMTKEAIELAANDIGIDVPMLVQYAMNRECLSDVERVVLGGVLASTRDKRMISIAAELYMTKKLRSMVVGGDIKIHIRPLDMDYMDITPEPKPKPKGGKYDFSGDFRMPVHERIGMDEKHMRLILNKLANIAKKCMKNNWHKRSYFIELLMNEPGLTLLDRVYLNFHYNYKRYEFFNDMQSPDESETNNMLYR